MLVSTCLYQYNTIQFSKGHLSLHLFFSLLSFTVKSLYAYGFALYLRSRLSFKSLIECCFVCLMNFCSILVSVMDCCCLFFSLSISWNFYRASKQSLIQTKQKTDYISFLSLCSKCKVSFSSRCLF